jgi:hypothetical protein
MQWSLREVSGLALYSRLRGQKKTKHTPIIVTSGQVKTEDFRLFDEDQAVYQQFGATRTPHVFLLDENLIVRYIGAIDDNPEAPNSIKNRYLENALEAILLGGIPNPDFTRAVGCMIKKKKT